MEKSKKSSPNKSEQDLGNNKNKKLVKSKSSNFDSDVDADVEDELSESDLAVISKPKLVRKSASLSLTSPEKGTNFPYFFPIFRKLKFVRIESGCRSFWGF